MCECDKHVDACIERKRVKEEWKEKVVVWGKEKERLKIRNKSVKEEVKEKSEKLKKKGER